MRMLALASLLAFGCAPEIDTGGTFTGNGAPGAPPGGGNNGGGGGGNASPCPDGQQLVAGQCVPAGVTCAAEFPCPAGQTCSGGRCITVPGPCMTNDNCPTGDVCSNGACVPTCAGPNAQ